MTMTTLERASFNQTLNLSNVEGHPNKDGEHSEHEPPQ